jgi:hypothetical protein
MRLYIVIDPVPPSCIRRNYNKNSIPIKDPRQISRIKIIREFMSKIGQVAMMKTSKLSYLNPQKISLVLTEEERLETKEYLKTMKLKENVQRVENLQAHPRLPLLLPHLLPLRQKLRAENAVKLND